MIRTNILGGVRKYKAQLNEKGYALPTVLITGLVLLAIGASGMQLVASTTRSINDQYWNTLASQAKDSGMKYVQACIQGANDQVNPLNDWTGTITQKTDCSGTTSSTAPDYIASQSTVTGNIPKWRTSFTATVPANDASLGKKISKVIGTVEVLGAANSVIRTYSSASTVIFNITPGSTNTAKKVVTSPRNTCVLAEDTAGTSSVYCSGDNSFGQLGDGTTISRTTPVRYSIPTGYNALDVAMYANGTSFYDQICVTGSNGTLTKLWCAGYDNGAFGQNSTASAGRPTPVLWGGGSGTNIYGTVNMGGDGNFTTICVPNSGTSAVNCSGNGTVRQLGNIAGGPGTGSNVQVPVAFHNGTVQTLKLSSYIGGARNVCALKNDNTVYCAGNTPSGQFGDGSSNTSTNGYGPKLLFGSSSYNIVDIANGTGAICALTNNALLYCTGEVPTVSQTKNTATVFGSASTFVKDFSVGSGHICIVTTDYIPKCVGSNANCQLGNNPSTCGALPSTDVANPLTLTYTPPTGPSYVVTRALVGDKKICLYYTVTGAENTTGVMSCSGDNTYGQFGNGSATSAVKEFNTFFNLPANLKIKYPGVTRGQPIPGDPNVYRNMELPGTEHVCVIATDNQAYCSGRNQYGQLGNSTSTNTNSPVKFKLP